MACGEEALGLVQTSAILARPTDDITWTLVERANDYPDSIAVPMLLISGWYDHFPDDVIRAFGDLRAVFSVHPEPFTVLSRKEANVTKFEDLKGKRFNVGNPGSGTRASFDELLAEMIGSARETVTRAVDALEQNGFLRRQNRGYVLRVSPGALER